MLRHMKTTLMLRFSPKRFFLEIQHVRTHAQGENSLLC